MPETACINAQGRLEIGGCDTVELAGEFGTPLYVVDEETLRASCRAYQDAFSPCRNKRLLFASKAFMAPAICRIVMEEGFGLEVVSGGEIFAALHAGAPMETLSFNGNNKSRDEIETAMELGVGRIVADNFSELALLQEVAHSMGKKAEIMIRVTPGIECHTHEYIRTGQSDSKFGFDLAQVDEAVGLILNNYKSLTLTGLHAHIGSQIFEVEAYRDEVAILTGLMAHIRDKHGLRLGEMNVGGGLGIRYVESDDPPSHYDMAKAILDSLDENCKKHRLDKPTLIVEPGRSIVGTAGVTLYTAGAWKQVPGGTRYLSVDGGMADNPRPSLYQAKYEAVVADRAGAEKTEKITLAGRYCESGDVLIKDAMLAPVDTGDTICVFNTGAYNHSMSSNYNNALRPAAVLVKDGQAELIVRRETFNDLVSHQIIPDRLKGQMAKSHGCCASCNCHPL